MKEESMTVLEGGNSPAMLNSYNGEIKRQPSFSLYPNHNPATPTRPRTATSPSPSLLADSSPHISIPSRSDSLLNRKSRQPQPHQESNPTRSFTSPPTLQQTQRPSEASRLRALNSGYRSQSSERRNHTPEPVLENFSRPLVGRDRGFSTSSSQSAYTNPTMPLRPSASIPDFHPADNIHSRQRNLNSNSGYRAGRGGMSRPDSNYSSHRREPIPRPNGYDSEEVRASFRSALTTTSSIVGASGTERSSIMTKSSSATSVFGKDDGMSVDDFLGMYEGGFRDSMAPETRPTTADSEQLRISALCEAMNDTLMVPGKNVTIRDSTAIFRNPGLDHTYSQGTPESLERQRSGSMSGMEDSPADLTEEPDLNSTYFEQRPTTSGRPLTGNPPLLDFDATRDRYGFRRKNQHVSLEEYEAWNGPYTEYLERRRKKWIVLMKKNGLMTDRPNRFPPKSAKVKHFVRKGIPPDWRGAAWFYYAGGPAMLSANYGVYDDLVKRAAAGDVTETDDEIIERDLHRTFPDNVRFKEDNPDPSAEVPETEILQSLRRVLQAFSILNPKIGYCQSLNFLAGLLLLFMNEEKSFWMLNIITRVYLPGTHEGNLEGVNVDLGVLMMSVKESMPSVWAKIGGELDGSTFDPKVSMRLPPITLCTTAWFMSCFIGTLPIETTLRVWDSFFYEGSKTLFRIALTIFKLGEMEIKGVTDPMEIFQVVQTIPRRLVDANAVLEGCFRKRFGRGLTQEKIETRRAERRKGYADERAVANGEVVNVKRKAPVFGRRKIREAVMA